jgi:hypothetical protein
MWALYGALEAKRIKGQELIAAGAPSWLLKQAEVIHTRRRTNGRITSPYSCALNAP